MWHVRSSSLIRNQTPAPCTGRQILSHWTTSKVPRATIEKADEWTFWNPGKVLFVTVFSVKFHQAVHLRLAHFRPCRWQQPWSKLEPTLCSQQMCQRGCNISKITMQELTRKIQKAVYGHDGEIYGGVYGVAASEIMKVKHFVFFFEPV